MKDRKVVSQVTFELRPKCKKRCQFWEDWNKVQGVASTNALGCEHKEARMATTSNRENGMQRGQRVCSDQITYGFGG